MEKYKIPASITLAQGILESGNGLSTLAKKSNNHFGIKCHKGWKGERVYHDDDEKGECFRKYTYVQTSYEDHSKFLTSRQRYAGLFKLKKTDYKGWARGLKKAGYATDKKYPKKLIKIIQDYKLYEFDKFTKKDLKKGSNEIDYSAALNKKQLEKKYLDILTKAKSVKEILEVEKELGKLREDIESVEGRLKYLQNQVSFSTLSINFYKTESNSSGFGKRISNGFSNGFENLKSFFRYKLLP